MTTNDFNQLKNDKDAWRHLYRTLNHSHPPSIDTFLLKQQLTYIDRNNDTDLGNWLIGLFNALFKDQQTVLVRGGDEPNYYAKTATDPAQIVFAHGYVSSALHEISHWCIAGSKRRLLDDFGYWYCPDGRSQDEQIAFEQVEVRPQAIECLLSYALDLPFFVSMDNLTGNKNPNSTFASDVYKQTAQFLSTPHQLPCDAKRLLALFGQLH